MTKTEVRVSYPICLFHKCPGPQGIFAGVKLNSLLTFFKKLLLWYPMGANQVSTGYHAWKCRVQGFYILLIYRGLALWLCKFTHPDIQTLFPFSHYLKVVFQLVAVQKCTGLKVQTSVVRINGLGLTLDHVSINPIMKFVYTLCRCKCIIFIYIHVNVSVHVKYETCKCKYKHVYIILHGSI